jgi:hypothetical protein
MLKWLREPLLHFLLLGAGLFLLYGWVGGPAVGAGASIVITTSRIEQLTVNYQRMHQRLPNAGELEELIDDAVREEIYYREAKALGLDQDDTIVRRRLRQKLEFVSEDLSAVPEPSEAELEAYLQQHPERFRTERRYGLTQLYLDPGKRGVRSSEDAANLLAALQREGAEADLRGRGDAALLPQRFESTGAGELARLFGEKFENALQSLPIGQWSGPVVSGYGPHLVLLRQRNEERLAPLAEVREQVRREWIDARRAEGNARFYAELRQRYEVTIERPTASGEVPNSPLGLR